MCYCWSTNTGGKPKKKGKGKASPVNPGISTPDNSRPLQGRKIGYDFDGVLHTSVYATDRRGKRDRIKEVPLSQAVPFVEMIEHIKEQARQGAEIFLITGKHKKIFEIEGYEFLKRPDVGLDEIIPVESRLAGPYHGGKESILATLKLDEYYDDSPKIISKIQDAMKQYAFHTKLFLVFPERSGTKSATFYADFTDKPFPTLIK